MRVALYVSRYSEDNVKTPPSLQYLAGYLVGMGLVRESDILFADSVEEIVTFQPHILGIGSVSQCFNDAVSVARNVRTALPECFNVLGGYHISALPQTLPKVFEVGVIGEGEITFAELAALRNQQVRINPEQLHEIRGICFHDKEGKSVIQTEGRPLIADIDSLPPPIRHLDPGQQWPYLFTARGCPYRCLYCASHSFWRYYRPHSAEYVVNEIARLVKEFRVSTIYLVDDLFIAPKERLFEIRRLLEERGLLGKLSFRGFIRINLVDEEVIRCLKEMGFAEVRFGMETASERLLARIKDRPFTVSQASEVIDLCNRYRLPVCASFMFGIPGETEADINASCDFLRTHRDRLSIAGFYLMQPVPGSRLWDECTTNGLVTPSLDFSRLELDMSKEKFDWSRILYLNEELLPLPRFRKMMEDIRREFILPAASLSLREKLRTIPRRIAGVGLMFIRRLLRSCGLEVRRISTPQYVDNSVRQKGGRLYVGCGEDSRPGYLGCDIRKLSNVSIVCNAWDVSKYCAELQEIYSRHMLEHLTIFQVETTLRDWMRALALGGVISVVVPDMDFHIEQWRRAAWNEEAWQEQFSDARHAFAGFWGWQRDTANPFEGADTFTPFWDVHKCGFNSNFIKFLLERAGFDHVRTEHDGPHLLAHATKTMDVNERQVSPSLSGIRSDHRGRYEFAARFVRPGDSVLDIASGIGYGSFLLASARDCLIMAVDLDRNAVEYARRHYQFRGIEFVAGNCLTVPLENEYFDVIVSFETIEHITDDKALLARFYEALKPDGKLLCSVPNQARMPYSRQEFPYHVRHYRPDEFKSLLMTAGFIVEQIWCQTDNQSEQVEKGWHGLFSIAVCRKG